MSAIKARRKTGWLAVLSTDASLSEEEIIRIYGKRWDIEVFFKSCKSYLRLVKECRSTSYDALNAHTAIVFTRYMMLSVAQRRNTDDRTLCELFFCLMDELDDITFSQSMRIIMDALIDSVMEYFISQSGNWRNSLPASSKSCQNIYRTLSDMAKMPPDHYFVS